MAEPNITNQELIDAAKAPASVSVDGVSVTNRSSQEMAQIQDQVANNSAARSPRRGLLFSKLVPGSAAGR